MSFGNNPYGYHPSGAPNSPFFSPFFPPNIHPDTDSISEEGSLVNQFQQSLHIEDSPVKQHLISNQN